MPILFPSNIGQDKYHVHFEYIRSWLKAAGMTIVDYSPADPFHCVVIGDVSSVYIDYADYVHLMAPDCQVPYFKFHSDGVSSLALSPISFYDWPQYFQLRNSIQYRAVGVISNRQNPSTPQRRRVRTLLAGQAEFDRLSQVDFWLEVNDCLVSVCVPGNRIDILDRGQLQYMAFGACTISPRLMANLPWNVALKADEDYVQCAPDFSDLHDKIEWCQMHPDACIEIGRNAQRKFDAACTPHRQLQWLEQRVS